MWSLNAIKGLNDRAVAAKKVRFPKYGVTGDVKLGLHLRCEQRLLTFYINPGTPSANFLEGLSKLDTEAERDLFIASHFPFAT